MFALLDDGELFVKTDGETRVRFVEAGCRQWRYVHGKVRMEDTGYFRPPDEAHEDPEAMLPWARLALDAALRARAAKAAKGAGKRARPGAGSSRRPARKPGARPSRRARPARTR
jgi:DNA transformation protein